MKTNNFQYIYHTVKLSYFRPFIKGVFKGIILLIIIISLITLTACVTDTINTFDSFTIQVPIEVLLTQQGNSDTTVRIENLNDYPEYRNNRERIKKIKLYQSAFWMDTLDPMSMDEGFKSLNYYIEIGTKRYQIASYTNITVRDFFRIPHVDQIPDSVSQEISNRLLQEEYFTTYLIIERAEGSTTYFNFIKSKVVVDLRIEVNL